MTAYKDLLDLAAICLRHSRQAQSSQSSAALVCLAQEYGHRAAQLAALASAITPNSRTLNLRRRLRSAKFQM